MEGNAKLFTHCQLKEEFIKLKQVLRTALIFRGAHQAKASSSQAHQATQVLHTLSIKRGVHQATQVLRKLIALRKLLIDDE